MKMKMKKKNEDLVEKCYNYHFHWSKFLIFERHHCEKAKEILKNIDSDNTPFSPDPQFRTLIFKISMGDIMSVVFL